VPIETNPASLARNTICEPLADLTSEQHRATWSQAAEGKEKHEHAVAAVAISN